MPNRATWLDCEHSYVARDGGVRITLTSDGERFCFQTSRHNFRMLVEDARRFLDELEDMAADVLALSEARMPGH